MKRILAAALCFLLGSGCSAMPSAQTGREATALVLALPEKPGKDLMETARELVRRGEDFSNNGLSFEIIYTADMNREMQEGTAQIYLTENSLPAQQWEALNFLELPCLFQKEDEMVSGVNSPQFLKTMNQMADLPVQLHRVAFGGYWNLVGKLPEKKEGAEPSALRIALAQPVFTEEAQKELGFVQVAAGEKADLVEYSPAWLTEKMDGTEEIFFTQHRMVLVDFFLAPQLKESLSPRNYAALEEAIVYAAGYCGTMAGQQCQDMMEQAQRLELTGRLVSSRNLFDTVDDIYGTYGKRAAPAYKKELARLLRQQSLKA